MQTYVRYWNGVKYSYLPWKQGEEIDYRLRFAVIQKCMDMGVNTMVMKTSFKDSSFLTIWIDDGRFRQS